MCAWLSRFQEADVEYEKVREQLVLKLQQSAKELQECQSERKQLQLALQKSSRELQLCMTELARLYLDWFLDVLVGFVFN